MQNNFDLKENLKPLWRELSTPTCVSYEYNSWLVTKPLKIFMQPWNQDAQSIRTSIGLEVVSKTYIGEPKYDDTTSDIGQISYVQNLPLISSIYTTVYVPISEAEKLSQQMMRGTNYYFEDSQFHVILDDIKLTTKDSFLQVIAGLTGDFRGQLYIQGIPIYDSTSQNIKFDQLDYQLETKNLIFKVAKWLFNKKILHSLQKNLYLSTSEHVQKTKLGIETALNKRNQLYTCRGKVNAMLPLDIRVLDGHIILRLYTQIQMSLQL